MKKIIILICFLLVTTYAQAGYNVCYDSNGLNLRVINSDPMTPTCIYFSDEDMDEYTRVKNLYKTVGLKYMKVVGGVVTEMSQVEKDTIAQSETDALIASQTSSINNLDITIKEAFIAWLAVYNSKVPVQYQVTGAELKAQVLEDKGL